MKKILFFFLALFIVSVVMNIDKLHSHDGSQKKESSTTTNNSQGNSTTPNNTQQTQTEPANGSTNTSTQAPEKSTASTTSTANQNTPKPQAVPVSSNTANAANSTTPQNQINEIVHSCQIPSESIYARGVGQDSEETILGVGMNELLCPDGNYQTCLYDCFSNIVCNDICPCLNSCYDNCRQYLTCGQWSRADLVAQITGVATKKNKNNSN